MEEIGFIRRDKLGKETWRNEFNDRVIFDEELKSVYFRDEEGKSFPVNKELMIEVIKMLESKGW